VSTEDTMGEGAETSIEWHSTTGPETKGDSDAYIIQQYFQR